MIVCLIFVLMALIPIQLFQLASDIVQWIMEALTGVK